MDFSRIRLEDMLDGRGVRIVLAAPPGNVLDAAMMEDLASALDALRERSGLYFLCFAGEGKHFSFGASVQEHVREMAPAMLSAFHGLFRRLSDLALPTAAAVRGRCLGGGMELAAFCTRVAAHPGAVFAQPEIQLGVFAPVASVILPLRVGQARADDILLSGRNVDAAEAKAISLADQVDENPESAVEEWARRCLLDKSASSLRHAVRAARRGWDEALRTHLPRLEAEYLSGLMATHDANEGLASFLEKRKPAWQHR